MDSVSGIARSAMEAFSVNAGVTANNIANATTENFTASKVTMKEKSGGGVEATVAKTADKVDISREAVDMMSTLSGFKANLQVSKVQNEMNKSILDIIT